MTQWILNPVIPKPGYAREFRIIREAMLMGPDDLDQLIKKLDKISATPKSFKPDYKSKEGILDVDRVVNSLILPAELRARATVEQLAVEAIDYGQKINRFIRAIPNPEKNFEIEREINYLRNVASWLLTWGKRGFGYQAI